MNSDKTHQAGGHSWQLFWSWPSAPTARMFITTTTEAPISRRTKRINGSKFRAAPVPDRLIDRAIKQAADEQAYAPRKGLTKVE